jgi:hypothetical protein
MTLSFTKFIGIIASATTISGAMDDADKMQTINPDNAYADVVWNSISLTHVEYPKGLSLRYILWVYFVFKHRVTSAPCEIIISKYCDYLPLYHVHRSPFEVVVLENSHANNSRSWQYY